MVEIAPGETKTLAPTGESARPGSFSRETIVASDPSLVRLVAGCELRWSNIRTAAPSSGSSLARGGLALKSFAPILAAAGLEDRISADVRIDVADHRAVDRRRTGSSPSGRGRAATSR